MNNNRLHWLILTILSVCAIGCAEERPPIDRVQPQALKKSHFVGEDLISTHDDPEFWTQATLIDVGMVRVRVVSSPTYAQPMSRIKWQITEDFDRSCGYERLEGSDGKGLGAATQDGIIAAAFRVKHLTSSKPTIRPGENSTSFRKCH